MNFLQKDNTEIPFDSPIADYISKIEKRKKNAKQITINKPKKTRIICISNQKGGVGKTTTVVNLAAVFAKYGARVLVIDLDPQGNASTALGADKNSAKKGTYHIMIGKESFSSLVVQHKIFNSLYFSPATLDLAGAEIELVSLGNREFILKNELQLFLLKEQEQGRAFDYVFIDCPPSLGLLTLNALVACSEVIIPIQAEYYALEGLEQLLSAIAKIKKSLNPDIFVSNILLTMYDKRTRLSQEVQQEVRKYFSNILLNSVIPRSVRLSEAPSFGQTIVSYDFDSLGSVAYLETAAEIANKS